MDYIVNEKVVVTHDGLKTIGASDTEIFLTPIPLRLLMFLIENSNIVISKEDVLSSVWENYGLVPSGASLSQHISKLRKCFKDFGFDDNIIETLPQKGIIFNASIEEVPSSIGVNITYNRKTIHSNGRLYMLIISLCIVLPLIISFCWIFRGYFNSMIFSENNYTEWRHIGATDGCDIFSLEENMSPELRESYLKEGHRLTLSKKIKCMHEDKILLDIGPYGPAVNPELSAGRKFFSFCQKSGNEFQCNNFYYSAGSFQ